LVGQSVLVVQLFVQAPPEQVVPPVQVVLVVWQWPVPSHEELTACVRSVQLGVQVPSLPPLATGEQVPKWVATLHE
jgi:hypothetical protein